MAVIATVGFSCLKDAELPSQEERLSTKDNALLNEAKQFFEKNYSPEVKTKTYTSEFGYVLTGTDFTPLWDKVKISQNDKWSYVEVLMKTENRLTIYPSNISRPNSNTQKRLLLSRNKSTGKIQMNTMLLIGDAGTTADELNGFKTLDPGSYSGVVYIFGMDTEFVTGYRYENGVRTARVDYLAPENPIYNQILDEIKRRLNLPKTKYIVDQVCYYQEHIVYEEWCYPVYGCGGSCIEEYCYNRKELYRYQELLYCEDVIGECPDCGMTWCNGECLNACSKCGAPSCDGHCNEGTGSGGDSGVEVPIIRFGDTIKTKDIHLLLESIIDDCAGQKLIEIANSNNITISNNPAGKYPATTNTSTGNIQWKDGLTELGLVEELFHSYQMNQGAVSNYKTPLGNIEIEAKVLVYRYAQRNNISFIDDPKSWKKMGVYSDNPTPENFPTACEALGNAGYLNYPTDVNKINMSRINSVSKDC